MRKNYALALCLLCFAMLPLIASGLYEDRVFPVENQQTLTVYSPHDSQPLYAAVKEFQEISGISVNVVSSGTGQLLERIRKEKEEGNPLCDVFWGGGAESIAANADLFEPFTSLYDDRIPKESKDSNSLWVGESPAPVVIIYNTILVSPQDVPTAWTDLLLPKWKGKIASANPSKSGSAYTLLCTMLTAFGVQDGGGWEFIRQFVGNLDGKILDNSADTYRLVADGTFYIGLSQEKSAQTYIQSGAHLGISYPREGTSAVPDAIALVEGCKHRELALQFIHFLLGQDNQNMMATLYYRRPVRTDLHPPKGLPPMSSIKLVDYDLDWASASKQEILCTWNEIAFGHE
ncbi:MAG: extracellular solute-binding protein [Spirochaetia bacterium]|nr:extracellular solute-binding protein [Spirochaetia bacterium]